MGSHAYVKRDRSVWWLWVGIFALVALLVYVSMHLFSSPSGDPIVKASQGIEADPDSLQDPAQPRAEASSKVRPKPVPTITLQGFQSVLPRPKITVTKTVPGPAVAGPTVTKNVPGPVTTKTVPGPTTTRTVTAPAVAPEPAPTVTVTVTATETVTVTKTVKTKPKVIKIYVPVPAVAPDPSPSGGE